MLSTCSERSNSRHQALPPEELISDLSDNETKTVTQIDDSEYRDDILRLMFVCCHPALANKTPEEFRDHKMALAATAGQGQNFTQGLYF